jgi:hypothetical protein
MTETILQPDKISESRINFLIQKGIDCDIAAVNLEMIKFKIQNNDDGLVWTKEQCEDGEIEYKRYLTLCRHFPYPKYSIVPNKIMDTMWHYHILDTRAYVKDSQELFGGYFHHFPYFGLRGEEDAKNLETTFGKTKDLYETFFGELMIRLNGSDCWHDCEDRCWHACSD